MLTENNVPQGAIVRNVSKYVNKVHLVFTI